MPSMRKHATGEREARSLFFAKVLTFCLVIGCGVKVGNPENPEEEKKQNLSGSVVMGPVSEAQVSLYAVNDDGSRGKLLAETTTDKSGAYSLSYEGSGPYLVVASGGAYEDEASGEPVNNGKLETILGEQPEDGYAAVTALTTMAAKNAARNASDGLDTAIVEANSSVPEVFGYTDLDIVATDPADLTTESSEVDPDSSAADYGLILSGLSQVVSDHSLSASALPEIVTGLAEDYADGGFDGQNDGEPLSSAPKLAPKDALGGLSAAVENFLAGPRNKSGIAADAIDIPTPSIPSRPNLSGEGDDQQKQQTLWDEEPAESGSTFRER